MLRTLVAAASLTAILTTPATAQRKLTVISAGSEQALAAGKTVLSRPFGAQLVDRLAVVGSYPAGPTTYHLVRGDAAGACPSRFVVVATRAGTAPAISEPFGTCAGTARATARRGGFTVTMPATAAGGPTVRFAWQDGRMRLIDARPAGQGNGGAPGFGTRQASTCTAPTSADPAQQAAVLADFEDSYPDEFRRAATLRKIDIAPQELREMVAGLACLSRWPGAESAVPEAATPLFASKRHGPAAFEAIDQIARDPLSDVNLRAAVRAFGAEMLYRVDRRAPL